LRDILQVENAADRDKIVSKLDSALLFFTSSLIAVFSIGYAILALDWLVIFFPLLIISWVMPIYIGYIRGALIYDSIDERIRGWTYFIYGAFYYCTLLVVFALTSNSTDFNLYLTSYCIATFLIYTITRLKLRTAIENVIIHSFFKIGPYNIDWHGWIAVTYTECSALSFSLGSAIIVLVWFKWQPASLPLYLTCMGIGISMCSIIWLLEHQARLHLEKTRLDMLFKKRNQDRI